MTHLINMLTDFGFDKSALTAIENYNSRDGFSLIDNDEYKSITGYFIQYPMYKDIIPIMTDNQSNYICVYKSGALFGKVCHVSHEEVSMEPKFRSIENLIAAINQNPDSWEWWDLPENLEDIYPFLDDDDMYIQERAIRIFGFHKYKPAVQKLRELETTAKHNGQFAAKLALKKIQSEQ